MEHFDEKILPDFKHSICSSVAANVSSYESLIISHHSSHTKSSSIAHKVTQDKFNQRFKKLFNRTKKNKTTVLCVKGQMSKIKLRMNRQSFQMRLQNMKLQEQAKKIQDQDVQLAEMKKHFEEWEQKLQDLTAELSRAREEVQKPDTLDSCKRKISDISSPHDPLLISKELQVKKRKLIVDRKSSSDSQDVKFKRFMSELLGDSSLNNYPQTSKPNVQNVPII